MKRRYLDNAPLFVALSNEERQAVAERFALVRFAGGERLFSQGNAPRALFLLKSGTVRLIIEQDDAPRTLATYEAGSLLGAMDLLLDHPHEATATAQGSVEAWQLTRDAFSKLLATHPSLQFAFPVHLSEHLLTPVDRGAAAQALRNVPQFSTLSAETVQALVGCLALRHAEPNETIYSAGEAGDALYLVEQGAVKLLDGSETAERKEAGDFFGEMALLIGRPRTLTARAARATSLWVLAKRDFDALSIRYPELTHAATRVLIGMLARPSHADADEESDEPSLGAFPLFAALSPDEQAEAGRRLRPLRVATHETLFREGDTGEALYLVQRGQVKLTSAQGVLDIVGEGGFFGEMALLSGNPHGVTAQAIEPSDLLVLGRDDFEAVMDDFPSVALLLSRALDSRLEQASTRGALPPTVVPLSPRPSSALAANALPRRLPLSLARVALLVAPLLLVLGAIGFSGGSPALLAAFRPSQATVSVAIPPTPLPERGAPVAAFLPSPTETPEPSPTSTVAAPAPPTRTPSPPPPAMLEPTLTVASYPIAQLLQTTMPTVTPEPSATPSETPPPTETAGPSATRVPVLPPTVGLPPTVALPPTRTPLPVASAPDLPPTVFVPTSAAESPTPESTLPAAAPPSPTTAPPVAAEAPRNLDSRLRALGVTIEPASVAPGEPYWRVVEIVWHDESQSDGRHSIFVDVLDEAGSRVVGQPLTVSWGGGNQQLTLEAKPFPEYGANFPMFAAGQAYSLQVDGLPSDRVHGLGLGDLNLRDWTIHVEYLIRFQRAIR